MTARSRTVRSLADMRNLGPVSERQLREIGIEGPAALERLGAVAAYRRLKHRFPREVTLVMLYALEGALRDLHWNRLPPGLKERLRQEAAALPPSPGTRPKRRRTTACE